MSGNQISKETPIGRLLSDAGVDSTFFADCDCPRVISLLEAIYMPICAGYFNFSAHLLRPLLYELSLGHVNSRQAIAMYLRLLHIHENNLKEIDSINDSNLESSADSLKANVIAMFDSYAKNFQLESRKYEDSSGLRPVKQPLCREALVNRIIGKK